MADKKQTPGDEPEPATEPETDDPADDLAADLAADTTDDAADGAADGATDAAEDDPADDVADDAAEVTPALADAEPASSSADEAEADGADEADEADADERPTGPFPTRVGWVVAAFLLFWPLAIPALVLSMRTAEANGTGNVRRAEKSSVRTLDFALGAVTLGVLGIVGLAVGIVAAPTYASSLPAGFVSAVRSFVPPALAGPLGITLPDDGPEVAAPTSSPDPSDPYAVPLDPDPSATDPYADVPADDLGETPEADDQTDLAGEPIPEADETATAGAEIPDLAVGDCFDTSATSGQTTLYRVPVVPCSTAHGGEIYAETTAPDSLARNGSAPTQQALWDAADAYCYPEFTKFVGMRWARSELLYWPIAPSEESWAEGDRRILCVVESEQPVTGSLKGAAR
ncbi:septum formation family protein [Promicromonospora sp. CA-289599]|uniref:septum formation family protein n=1 Tax=Promicromonospora sp. CA-289599 TaxID=3240014 RepID=UPI003D89E4BD